MKTKEFYAGIKDGIPICLGYFSVSMAFGLTAVKSGLPVWSAILISLTNLTSAGQFAGVKIILAGGKMLELFLTTLIINMRYFLMSVSVSQRADKKMTLIKRLIVSFAITDEIFAVSTQRKKLLSTSYMAGLILMPVIGWTGGTTMGAVASTIIPQAISTAMGISLYAMFIAIIIPPARKNKNVLLAIFMSVVLSVMFYYLPCLKGISGGWSVIIITLAVSTFCATFFPVNDEEEEV